MPKSVNGKTYVFSMLDRATGWVEMVATADATTECAVQAILSAWIPRFGVPKALVADNGSHFQSHELKEVCRKLSIKTKPVVPYHPQGNGAVERRFREMIRQLGFSRRWIGIGKLFYPNSYSPRET